MRSGFHKLPVKYWAERQFLIQMGGRLPLARATVISFLTEEMSRRVNIFGGSAEESGLSDAGDGGGYAGVCGGGRERAGHGFPVGGESTDGSYDGVVALSRYEVVDAARARALASELELIK